MYPAKPSKLLLFFSSSFQLSPEEFKMIDPVNQCYYCKTSEKTANKASEKE